MLAFILAVALVTDAQHFDLVCSGMRETEDVKAGKQVSGPFETRFRINLADRAFCSGECKDANTLAEVTDTIITFSDELSPGTMRRIFVSRRSGSYLRYEQRSYHLFIKDSGTCLKADYTAIPEKVF